MIDRKTVREWQELDPVGTPDDRPVNATNIGVSTAYALIALGLIVLTGVVLAPVASSLLEALRP
jgi:hypothetical protein